MASQDRKFLGITFHFSAFSLLERLLKNGHCYLAEMPLTKTKVLLTKEDNVVIASLMEHKDTYLFRRHLIRKMYVKSEDRYFCNKLTVIKHICKLNP